jgi:hypothetical protein
MFLINSKIITWILSLGFYLILPQENLYCQNEKIEIIVYQGLNLIEADKLDSAEIIFDELTDMEEGEAYGYIGQGLIHDKKNPGSSKAIRLLERAVRIDSENVKARYYLGLIHKHSGVDLYAGIKSLRRAVNLDPNYVAAWVELVEIQEMYNSSSNLDVLIDAVKANPLNAQLYMRFYDYVIWNSYEEDGADFLAVLLQKYPNNDQRKIDLALFYYQSEQFDAALDVLENINLERSNYIACNHNLIRARIAFDLDKDSEGLVFYNEAIKFAIDSSAANSIFEDLIYIADSDEWNTIHNLPVDSISPFIDKFWKMRDPDLSTTDNERIPEHFRRLTYARHYYRRYVVGKSKYDLEHKSDQSKRYGNFTIAGDLLMKPYRSKALPDKIYYDDMGLIYIRHGEPDRAMTNLDASADIPDVGVFFIMNLSWLYVENYQ